MKKRISVEIEDSVWREFKSNAIKRNILTKDYLEQTLKNINQN